MKRYYEEQTVCWCYDCKEFVHVNAWQDTDTGYRCWECSECGSEEVEEARRCDLCGEYARPDEWFCDHCLEGEELEIQDPLIEQFDISEVRI